MSAKASRNESPDFSSSPFSDNLTRYQAAFLGHRAEKQARAAEKWLKEVRGKVNREFSIQVTESGLQLVPEPENPEEHFADLNKEEQHDKVAVLRDVLDELNDNNGHPCPTFETLANAIMAYLTRDLETSYSIVIRRAHVACQIHMSLHYPIALMEHNLAEFLKGQSGHSLTPFLEKLGVETLEAHVRVTPRFQIASQEAKAAWMTDAQRITVLAQAGLHRGCLSLLAKPKEELAWGVPEGIMEKGVVFDDLKELMWDKFGPHPWPYLVLG